MAKTFTEQQIREILKKGKLTDFEKTMVAEELGIILEPRKFSTDVHLFSGFTGSEMERTAVFCKSGSGVTSNNKGNAYVNLLPLVEETFGKRGWAGRKFKVTVEEILDQ